MTQPVLSPSSAPTTVQPTSQIVPTAVTESSLLPGVNVLLEGPTGTGKTYSLGTIADAGVELFVLFTENALETLLGYWTDRGLAVPSNVHWHILPAASANFATLEAKSKMVLDYTQDALYKMSDNQRSVHNQMVKLFAALVNFSDDRTGQKFGPVDSWGPNRCLAISTLSGINPIAMSLVIGNKPIRSQTDWGIAQDQIMGLIRKCTDCPCHFILEAHVERELVLDSIKVTVSTLGKAIAPVIPTLFSDVILAERKQSIFSWSTANPFADLKTRNLSIAENIKPDFKQIIDKWQSRGGRLVPGVKR